jgi:hypothetical protein
MAIGPIQLLKQASPGQRSTLLAAALGWMLDAFDAMLYAHVLTYVMRDLGMSKAASGLLCTLRTDDAGSSRAGRPRHTPDMVLPSLAKPGAGLIISSQRRSIVIWIFTMPYAQAKEKAHELIDRMAPSQVSAVVGLLETMLDPVSRAIANAAVDDEPESEAEREAVAASKAWMAQHPGEGIPHEDIVAEFGRSGEDPKR